MVINLDYLSCYMKFPFALSFFLVLAQIFHFITYWEWSAIKSYFGVYLMSICKWNLCWLSRFNFNAPNTESFLEVVVVILKKFRSSLKIPVWGKQQLLCTLWLESVNKRHTSELSTMSCGTPVTYSIKDLLYV